MMDKEYEIIRKTLIALLCVGDTLNWIHSDSLMKHHWIDPYIISEITPYRIIVTYDEWRGAVYRNRIEYYRGKLYIWDVSDAFYPYRGKKRIKEIYSMLELLGV
jgi:hypothetical protein